MLERLDQGPNHLTGFVLPDKCDDGVQVLDTPTDRNHLPGCREYRSNRNVRARGFLETVYGFTESCAVCGFRNSPGVCSRERVAPVSFNRFTFCPGWRQCLPEPLPTYQGSGKRPEFRHLDRGDLLGSIGSPGTKQHVSGGLLAKGLLNNGREPS